ncbi:MAG TPA: cell wall-binding repeat-containing protein [Desulfosporosinus sp.]|nr:cell wall-binding repeat-containing protein [Desulfosporosinus sp.]
MLIPRFKRNSGIKKFISCLAILVVLFNLSFYVNPVPVKADNTTTGEPSDQLEVKVGYKGEPYTSVKTYQSSDLEALPQVQKAYTFIDNMPCPVIDSAVGVKLSDILKDCAIDEDNVKNFTFYTTDMDGKPYKTLSKDSLLDTKRYYFPHIAENWSTDDTGEIVFPDPVAAAADAEKVPTIIALYDNWQRQLNGSLEPDFSDQDDSVRFRLLFGKTDDLAKSRPEHTASSSAKWIYEIDVTLVDAPEDNDHSGSGLGSSSEPSAPALTTINSSIDQAVVLNFTDNASWRTAINSITVDGVSLTAGQYTVETGKINIASGVLNASGNHAIVIKATGFADAKATQTILTGTVNPAPVNSGPINLGGDNTAYNQAALAVLANVTEQQTQDAQIPVNASVVNPAATAPVTLTTNDGLQLLVPPGAVGNRTTSVQMTVALGTVQIPPKAEYTAVVLNPLKYQRQLTIKDEADGSTQFNAPVNVTFPVSTTDLPSGIIPQKLAIYRWDSGKSDWVKLGGAYDTTAKTISISTYQFATYAVMADTGSTLERLAGDDCFATAIAVAEQGWKTGADNVVLANAYVFSDALAAAPLAYKLNAPILLTDGAALTPSTLAEVQKLAPKTITLIGGTAVISQAIQDSLSSTYGAANVQRYGGTDRYATAAAIASALGTTGKAVIANGEDGHYSDALAISSYAAYNGIPVLFTEAAALPAATAQALTAQKVSTTIVAGGESVVTETVYQRLPGATRYAGTDCYATATAIAEGLHLNLNKVYVVTGLNFPDAIVASNLAAHTLSPIIMVDKGLPDATCTFLATNRTAITDLIDVGGEGVITEVQNSAMRAAMK